LQQQVQVLKTEVAIKKQITTLQAESDRLNTPTRTPTETSTPTTTPSPTPTPVPEPRDLALRQSVAASSELKGYPGSNAVDGDVTTIASTAGPPPGWFEVTLDGEHLVEEVRVVINLQPGRKIAMTIRILVNNKETGKTSVKEVKDKDEVVIEINPPARSKVVKVEFSSDSTDWPAVYAINIMGY
jgi:hypothetical protein